MTLEQRNRIQELTERVSKHGYTSLTRAELAELYKLREVPEEIEHPTVRTDEDAEC